MTTVGDLICSLQDYGCFDYVYLEINGKRYPISKLYDGQTGDQLCDASFVVIKAGDPE
jgi:hypothetical protein